MEEIMRKQDKAGKVFRLVKTHPIWHLFKIEYLDYNVWKPAKNKIMLHSEALSTFNAITNS
jgi:hypothetical protein